MGVYCINAARNLFREEPTEVVSFTASSSDKRFAEVQEMASALLRFPDGRLATFTASFGAADRSSFEVIGTKGVLKMDPAYEMVGDLKSELIIGERIKKSTFSKRDQFAPELSYFSNCILKNREPEPGGLEGLADVRIVDASSSCRSLDAQLNFRLSMSANGQVSTNKSANRLSPSPNWFMLKRHQPEDAKYDSEIEEWTSEWCVREAHRYRCHRHRRRRCGIVGGQRIVPARFPRHDPGSSGSVGRSNPHGARLTIRRSCRARCGVRSR